MLPRPVARDAPFTPGVRWGALPPPPPGVNTSEVRSSMFRVGPTVLRSSSWFVPTRTAARPLSTAAKSVKLSWTDARLARALE